MFRDGFVYTDITLSLIRGELRVLGYKLKGSVDTTGLTWKKKKVFQIRSGRAREPFPPPLLHLGEKKFQSLMCFSLQCKHSMHWKKKKRFTAYSGAVCWQTSCCGWCKSLFKCLFFFPHQDHHVVCRVNCYGKRCVSNILLCAQVCLQKNCGDVCIIHG